ncbi:hypothetical protein ES703_84310 [subsurface metagenome]
MTQPANDKKNLTNKNSKRTVKSQIKGFKKQGYVIWWRGFRDDPLWKQKRKFSKWEAFEDLYLEARGLDSTNFQFGHKIVDLKRGQLITSQRILAKRWHWSRGSVRNFLKKLERRSTIIAKTFSLGRNGYTIITFLKYNELNPLNKIEKK